MQPNRDLERLEGLIARATTPARDNPQALLAEHLDAARRYLLSNSRLEYGMTLAEVMKTLTCVDDKDERNRIKDAVQGLIDTARPKTRAAASGIS